VGFRSESTVGFLIAKLILASGIEEEMDIKNNAVFDEPYGGCWPGIQKLTERATYLALIVFILTNPLDTHAQTWSPVTSKEKLTQIFSDTTFKATLKGGVKATAHYDADGTGELDAWGDTYAREWKIEGNDQVCVKIDKAFQCFRFEQNPETDNEYRATNVITGESIVISVMPQGTTEVDATIAATGGPAQPSAEEMAAKLSNPTSPVMTIGNNFDYVTFKGDLPGSEDESSFRYVFQTTFPLKLKNGGSVFFRPAIPVFFNEPVPDGLGGFSSEGTDLGDTGFDLSYGITTPGGLLWGVGMVGTIPTASNDKLGKDLWGLGPEVLLGALGKWGVVGGILAHQWDIAGSGDGEIDLTSLTYFYAFPLGGGWQIAAGPSVSYDHTRPDDDRWTIPLGVGLAKTSIIDGRPWKFQLQYWNYVESAEAFSSEHQIRLSINPVVSASWNDDR
jgi:hypothetical protein